MKQDKKDAIGSSNKHDDDRQIPSASDYMRSTRPELFSDSVEKSESLLTRSQLEYHLETLTNRKQEFIFENFCRRLAEMELCPNLKPQTGPVGGGDSKTDSSTYPVSEVLIERCYWGSPNPPTNERWAFAFSCKKQWRQKARDDVAKIADLSGDYSTAYFVTSQFVKDKSRSDLEDELSQKFGRSVHILDRTWILDIVFSHQREDLAIDALGMSLPARKERRLGARDTIRQAEFDQILKRLRDPLGQYANDYSLAAEYLHAAQLARALERPPHEVRGFYLQARRIAAKYGYLPQSIRCAYEHAWTENWWYDDPAIAAEVYIEIEPFLQQLEDGEDVEMFANLQSLLWQAVFRGKLDAETLNLTERENALRGKLKRLSESKLRPNNALYAATMLAFLDLRPWNGELKGGALLRIADCFKQSRGLATYPLKKFTDTVLAMSDFIESHTDYEQLFSTICAILKEREGDIAEGRLQLQRGEQHLRASRPKDALHLLSQARINAAKVEILENSVRAANLAANSYLHLGLPWAARMEALVAARLSCEAVDGVFQSAYHGFRASRLLAWIDLSQGRLGPFLRWMQIANACLAQLVDDGYDPSHASGAHHKMEAALCDRLMLLNKDSAVLIAGIAAPLQSLGFPMARFVLLHQMGHTREIEEEFSTVFKGELGTLQEFCERWKAHLCSRGDGVLAFNGWDEEVVSLSATIMNVRFVIESCVDFGAIAFSENLLGVIESMLALADWKNLAFIADEVRIKVLIANDGQNPPAIVVSPAEDDDALELIWNVNVGDWVALTDRDVVIRYLLDTCLLILLHATIDPVEDLMAEFGAWVKGSTLDRSLGTSPTIHAVNDLIGRDCYDLKRCIAAASSAT